MCRTSPAGIMPSEGSMLRTLRIRNFAIVGHASALHVAGADPDVESVGEGNHRGDIAGMV